MRTFISGTSQVLRDLYYDTALAGARHSPLPALEVTSADHILFGTDWPTAPERTVVRGIEGVDRFGFSGEHLANIWRGNASRLFPRFTERLL